MDNNFALIMAGGQGTRFWPYSTLETPKQFLNIVGDSSLLLQTFRRLEKIVNSDNIFIVAHSRYKDKCLETIPNFSKSNFIDEPIAKNTAPCLILSNIVLSKIDEDAKLLVVPADHYIPDSEIFTRQMQDAFVFAEQNNIITFGITPNSPHTGYGYIKYDENKAETVNNSKFYNSLGFKEKPDLELAKEYVKDGTYLWNSGMFVYKLKNFKNFLKEYSDYFFNEYLKLERYFEKKEIFVDIFSKIKPDSIDFALMEKVKELKISPARFGWNDVGSWSSIYELNEKDERQNVKIGETALIDTSNSMAFSTEKKPIAIIGLDDVVVINTENGILVSKKDKLQDVKKIKKLLRE